MLQDFNADLEMYAAMLDYLPEYDDWLEVANLLDVRDWIERSISGGTLLTDEQCALLRQADDRLISLRAVLLRFPEVFEERGAPRSYWWWHLDEGPQVREQALIAADRP